MMKIATKYPRIAERYFESRGRQVELVEVKGSIELAPLVGLADAFQQAMAWQPAIPDACNAWWAR